jgi:hypothetical protein
MKRGPVALFGAIIAVGLGPALWLGAQFGTGGVSPVRPPITVDQQQLPQGGGAGAAPDTTARILDTESDLPRSVAPRTSAAPTPKVGSTRTVVPTQAPGVTVSPTAKPSVSTSATPATPPAEPTDPPTTPADPAPPAPNSPIGVTLALP